MVHPISLSSTDNASNKLDDRKNLNGKESTAELATETLAQDIMRQVHALYSAKLDGLTSIGNDVGLTIHPPRRKVGVLVIGNHSAGKSSFLNWYIEDEVQSTGVAIETQGFTFVTSGTQKTLAPIKGESTIMLYPYLKELKQKFGKPLVENLTTVVSTSTAKHFPMVDFIDSPGLVDGDISYPFDVNEAILAVAAYVDLILVFLDPMGQALCSRTMKVVKALNATHYDKMRYYLSKADTVSKTQELMKLMVQITQNIKENINNQHGLEIPAIWLPSHSPNLALDPEINQLQKLCDNIEKTIHQKVQDNLNQVEEDCTAIRVKINSLLHKDQLHRAAKRSRQVVATFLFLTAWMIPTLLFIALISKFQHLLPQVITHAEIVQDFLSTTTTITEPLMGAFPQGVIAGTKYILGLIAAFIALISLSKFLDSRTQNFVTHDKNVIKRWRNYENTLNSVLEKRQEFFTKYVRAYTKMDDL